MHCLLSQGRSPTDIAEICSYWLLGWSFVAVLLVSYAVWAAVPGALFWFTRWGAARRTKNHHGGFGIYD